MGDRFRVYISAQDFGEGAHFRFGITYALYRRRPYDGLLLEHYRGIEPRLLGWKPSVVPADP